MIEKSYDPDICNICGSDRFRRIHYFAAWNLGRDPVKDVAIVRCFNCGIRRRQPGISDDFEAEYHAPYVEQGQAIHPHQLSHFADLMTTRLRRFNEKHVEFLDVGCSTGRILRLAATMGFIPTGLDYSQWAADQCAQLGFTTRHGSLIGQWTESDRFDVIHCSHTIEHVPDPMSYLREFHRLLKPDCHLMISFPNYASIQRIVLGDKWGPWCLDSHLWQFTARQMCRLLKQNGFTILSSRTPHGYTPDSQLKTRLLNVASALGFGDGCNIIALKR